MTYPSSKITVIGLNDDNHQNLFLKQDKKDQVDHEQTIEDNGYSDTVFKTENNLTRGLKQRHIQMLALVGIFGTGLFLSSGSTLALVYVLRKYFSSITLIHLLTSHF